MITLLKTSEYQKARNKYVKNNLRNTDALIKTLDIFVQNPTHPSLNLEKLGGTKLWTIRIDSGNRIFFAWIDESTALLIDVGKHDKYRKY